MKPIVLITGANGGVAKRFSQEYEELYTFRFLTRSPKKPNEYEWNLTTDFVDLEAFQGVNHILHLAGANIANGRWTTARKKELRESRIKSAQLIRNKLVENKLSIDSFISASAIGYYGNKTSDKTYSEDALPDSDFISQLCADWEEAADQFKKDGLATRVVKLRIGVVLDKTSKLISALSLLTKFHLGSALGSGKQYMPWIHIEDLCGIVDFCIRESKINGAYNTVAPTHITNKELTQLFADVLDKKFFLPNIPSFLLKLIFGKQANIFIEGSRVDSKKIEKAGYTFKFGKVKEALLNILLAD